MDIWITSHGPVVFNEGGVSYSVKWTAAEGFGFPFLAIDGARNWDEFRMAVAKFWGPPQNFVYADRLGNIGYQASGGMPIRNGFTGDVPLDGASGTQEWKGYVAFGQLPSFANPASGIVATANQNPFPADATFGLSGSFADRYRIDQILDRLRAKPKFSVDDMLSIQKDVYSAYHHFLASQAVSAVQHKANSDAAVKEAGDRAPGWNGQMDKDQASPFIAELLHYEMGHSLGDGFGAEGEGRTEATATSRGDTCSDSSCRLGSERRLGCLAIDCLKVAIEEGRKRQGSPVSSWRWGKAQTWKIVNPVGGQFPLVDRFFNIGPVADERGGDDCEADRLNFGPSMRMVVDWGNIDHSVQNLTSGESGFVTSSHYKDQWDAYYVGHELPDAV